MFQNSICGGLVCFINVCDSSEVVSGMTDHEFKG